MEEDLIISDPNIMVGKPIIRGTRITVELILNKLAANQTIDQILQDYPHLTREGIQSAIRFAAESVRSDHVHPVHTTPAEQAQA